MSIPLHISPKIIPSIASLYNDPNRIFMEYIDNAIDSAEELFDHKTNSYNRPIVIEVKFIGAKYNDCEVKIKDNCIGITNFTKVVKSIGDSDKKGQFTTNGQFGYGIYSFMASNDKLEISSKLKDNEALYLPIKKSQFNTSRQEDVSFPDPRKISFKGESGTEIRLTGFEKTAWKQISIPILSEEIEKHFELLLCRKNLEIRIIDQQGKVTTCLPFDYDKFEGDIYPESINTLETTTGTRYQKKFSEILEKPIKVYLKLTAGRMINKNPVFIIKGRRIAEIKDIRSFKSNHRSDIWGHPNLTGYVDLGGHLEPTIARNDFKNTPTSKAIFEKLIELEPLILEFLKDINKKSDERHYKELEDELNKALSKLARIDNMNFRTELIRGNNSSLLKNKVGNSDEGEGIEIVNAKEVYVDGPGGGEVFPPRPPKLETDDEGNFEDEIDGKNSNNNQNNSGANENDNPFDDNNVNADDRKKSGFNIEISDMDPDIDSENNQQLRSSLIGGTIRIFRKHPDFIKRADKKRTGESFITPRLITYLAGEITVHYKDKFVTREGQPDYNKRMFSSVVHFIYQFEEILSGLSGKNLGDFINADNSIN